MPLVQKPFGDIITFTRASTATYFDSTGTLQSAAINAPRLDYNPATLLPRGFLVEEQRTNSIRNNTMQGAVAGTPGTLPTNWSVSTGGLTGITQQIVGTGVESGITYLDIRFSGTPSAAGTYRIYTEGTVNIAAVTGQTWSNSQYLKLAAGTLTGVTGFTDVYQEFTSAGGFVTEAGIAISSPTTSALATQRSSTSRTLAGGATTAFARSGVQLTLSGAAIDITLRVGLPQLELGAFATSVIPTTTTALTRSADVASVNTLSPWFNGTEGTLYAEYTILTSRTSDVTFTRLDNGSDANRVQLSTGANFTVFNPFVITSNVTQGTSAVVLNPLGTHKIAAAVETNNFVGAMDGTLGGVDTLLTVPASISRLCIGNSNNANQFTNGYLRRITYYPRRLSNAELVSVTS